MKNQKKLILNISFIILVILIVCTFLSTTIQGLMQPQVEVIKPKSGLVQNNIYTVATINYTDKIVVNALADWQIKWVKEGLNKKVSPKKEILKIHTTDSELTLRELEFNLKQAKNALNSSRGDAAIQAQLAYDKALRAVNLHKQQYPEKGLIFPKNKGNILALYVKAGDFVTYGQPLMEIKTEKSKIMAEFTLSANDGSAMVVGDNVNLELPQKIVGRNAEPILGVIKSKEFNNIQNCWEFKSVHTKNIDDNLLGSTANITIPDDSDLYHNVIPKSAVNGEKGDYYVYLLKTRQGIFKEETYVEPESVTINKMNDIYVSINENITDNIIVNSSKPLYAGATVRLIEK